MSYVTAEYIPGTTNCVADAESMQDPEGLNRLEASLLDFQSNKPEVGSPGSGPVCIPLVHSASTFFSAGDQTH